MDNVVDCHMDVHNMKWPVGLARHCSPVSYGDGGQSWHRWCFWRWLFVWLEMVAIVEFTALIDYGGHAGILSVRVAKLKSPVINESLTLSVVLWTDCIFIWMMSFESWWMVVVDVECFFGSDVDGCQGIGAATCSHGSFNSWSSWYGMLMGLVRIEDILCAYWKIDHIILVQQAWCTMLLLLLQEHVVNPTTMFVVDALRVAGGLQNSGQRTETLLLVQSQLEGAVALDLIQNKCKSTW